MQILYIRLINFFLLYGKKHYRDAAKASLFDFPLHNPCQNWDLDAVGHYFGQKIGHRVDDNEPFAAQHLPHALACDAVGALEGGPAPESLSLNTGSNLRIGGHRAGRTDTHRDGSALQLFTQP